MEMTHFLMPTFDELPEASHLELWSYSKKKSITDAFLSVTLPE